MELIKKDIYIYCLEANFRLTNLQASIGLSQLKGYHINKKRRKEIFFLYKELFKKE